MLPKYLKDSTFSSCFWSIILLTGNGCLVYTANKNEKLKNGSREFAEYVQWNADHLFTQLH